MAAIIPKTDQAGLHDGPATISSRAASGGIKFGSVRYVLAIGVGAAILAILVVWLYSTI